MAARKKIDRLETYRTKRSPSRTPEPFGGAADGAGGLFVVQLHAARRLHYDFRLEMDGVLVSWAVPKGPSPNPADKRLAVHVEDHPLDYAGFEGRIPEGNYGAGAVIVWDRGLWRPVGDPAKGIEAGKLLFDLNGYKLRGRWTLVRTRQDWLLIKERDGYVSDDGTAGYPADSILSGLSVEELAAGSDRRKRIIGRLKKFSARAERVSARKAGVMLAKSGQAFSKPGWLFEIKYDGYRMLVERDGDATRLLSRAGNDLTASFPEIADVVAALPYEHVIIDGEAVVHDEQGLPSFARLQKRGRLTRPADIRRAAVALPATLYAFDLLGFDDYDLRGLPLEKRKIVLRELLPSTGPIRYSDHIAEHGEQMYSQVEGLGLEGIVAKRADSRYTAGRSADWVKISATRSDDFVIVGWTDPKGSQPGFGALLLAQYDGEALRYVGRVGSGFRRSELRELAAELERSPAADPPQAAPEGTAEAATMHWVAPFAVCEVRYKQITPDGLLRAPSFLRLRDDKPPGDCLWRGGPLPEPAIQSAPAEERIVPYTNLDKVFWPGEGYTKGQLIDYHRAIAEWLLPYLADRPVVLTRYPDGIEGKSFFQKDAPEFVPDWLRIERMWSESTERELRYFIVEDVESLAYIVNLGTIPLHIWSSRVSSLERPDWCILDLDPKEAPFTDVVRIARAVRRLCRDIELPCFLKTSGSTGLHVLIPLGASYSYEHSRTLGELLARVIAAELADIATVTRRPSARGGKVYIDYLQNGHGRLLVAPFSVRPLPGAPVSMPLRWSDLGPRLDNANYTITNAVERMKRLKRDPLRDVLSTHSDVVGALERLAERQRAD